MTRRQFAGGAARTTITGSIGSSGGGTVILADATGWPDGSVGPFHVVVDPGGSAEEKILMDSRVGTTLTFSTGGRGADGTVATSHSAGALIWHVMAAVDFDEANAHINSAATAHTAAQISFTPVGAIAATTVQAAIAELEGEAGDTRLDALEAADTAHTAADTALDTRVDAIEANNWVTTARILDANVTTAKILDGAVTPAKIENAAWTAYTPTVTGWGLGNGTVTGRYYKTGRHVSVHTEIIAGSTTSYGSALNLSLPFALATVFGGCVGNAYDASGGLIAPVFASSAASGTTVAPLPLAGVAQYDNAGLRTTVPWTWTTSDSVRLDFTYESST